MKGDFCKLPKAILKQARGRGGRLAQWPRGYTIKWSIVPRTQVGPFSRPDLVDLVRASWAAWAAVADVRQEYVSRIDDANVVMRANRIDGRGDILAQAQLPGFNAHPRTRLYLEWDVGENWVNAKNPTRSMQDIIRVTTHELGHNLGLDHAPRQSRNLMAPSVSSIREPVGKWDKEEIGNRYGPPITSPENPSNGGDGEDDIELLVFGRKIWGYDLADLWNGKRGLHGIEEKIVDELTHA